MEGTTRRQVLVVAAETKAARSHAIENRGHGRYSRARPDLNQGPADLQSAAQTTEYPSVHSALVFSILGRNACTPRPLFWPARSHGARACARRAGRRGLRDRTCTGRCSRRAGYVADRGNLGQMCTAGVD